MIQGNLRLTQLSMLTGLKRHAINARVRSCLEKDQIKRNSINQILLENDQVRSVIEDRLQENKGKIIYIGNLKGGVGKTTIAYLLTNVINALGLKTCAIDLDIQANLTRQYLDIDVDQPVFFDVIDSKLSVKNVIVELSSTFHFIPSSLKNSLIQKSLSMQSPKHHLSWFNGLCLDYLRSNYDVIIVDTPPHLTTLNSVFCLCLVNNDHIVIPACAEDFSIMGIQMLLEDIMSIRNSYKVSTNPKFSILMNKFFQNQKTNLEMLFKMKDNYQDMVSGIIIRDNAKIREIINNKILISGIKNAKEIYEILFNLLQEFNIIKKIED